MAETLLQIIQRKNERLETIPDLFQSNVEKLQRRIYNRITELIGELDVKDGQIVMSEANLLRVQTINDELKRVLGGKEILQTSLIHKRQSTIPILKKHLALISPM